MKLKQKHFPLCYIYEEVEMWFNQFDTINKQSKPMIMNAASWQDKFGNVTMILFYGN